MKHFAILLITLITAVSVGCSNKDNKNPKPSNDNSGTGGTEAEVESDVGSGDVTLKNGEDENSMTFNITLEGGVKIALSGEVTDGLIKEDKALSTEDGKLSAGVMAIPGKNYIYVVLHDGDDDQISSLYLFALNSETYDLKISNVTISRSKALQQINSALDFNMKNGLSLDESVNHMINYFLNDSSLIFINYLESLSIDGTVVIDSDVDDYDNEGGSDGSEGDQAGEPAPRRFPPAIKPEITGHSKPLPRPRPRPKKPRPPIEDEEPGGRVLHVTCMSSEAQLSVEGQRHQVPSSYGCLDKTNEKDRFNVSVVLDQSLSFVDSIKKLKLKINVDLSKPQFVSEAIFKVRPVLWPNNGVRWDKYGKDLLYYGANKVRLTRRIDLQAPFRDSFDLQMTCEVRRSYRKCGQ